MPRTKRKIDYLLQRPGSANWNIRLQYPGGKVIEKSLGTPDRRQAEVLALPLIAEHKARLLAAQPRLEPSWHREYEPGLHDGPNGERIAATDRELSFYSADGRLLRTEPNGGQRLQLISEVPLGERVEVGLPSSSDIKALKQHLGIRDIAKRLANADDAILETYLRHANVTGYYEREARDVWALYKRLTDDKPLKDAIRDDGRKLVAYYDNEGLKSATIQKKVGWLTSAVNLAIKEGRLKFNPFSSIVPKRDDKLKRLPLSEADMKVAKRNLDRLDCESACKKDPLWG